MCRATTASILAGLLAVSVAGAADPVDYLRDIKPILSSRCYSCHGALQQKAKLRLDAAALVRQGGRSGPAIVPGKSAESLLILRVTGSDGLERMPPEKEAPALAEQQITLLKGWIDQGAKAPDEPIPEDPRKHWAFRVPARPPLPKDANSAWIRNAIDAFIAAEHEKRSLRASPPAPKEVLLRRVYLDLIGLPPTREELHAFLNDPSDDDYEKVVDRLLASPHYGERWARHWMDVWRYSDWYGRRAVPDVWNSAPQIWRWRDWIVKSLNADKGYDRMVMEMLAADELAPEDNENIVATGYLVRNWYALNYHQWMKDNVEHTGKAFLGLTLNCAHCHDHKYDPITNEEYFRFRAFFEPLELRQDRVPGEPDCGPFQKYEYTVLRKVVKTGMIRVFDEKLDAKTYVYSMGDERNRVEGRLPVSPGAPAFLGGDKLQIESGELPPTAYYPGLKSFIQRDEIEKREKAVAAAREAVAGVKRQAARLRLAEARLATAEAELQSLQARVAADNVRYNHAAGNAEECAKAASTAERFAALCRVKEELVQAEQELSAAQQNVKAATAKAKDAATAAVQKAEHQLATAKKGVDTTQKGFGSVSTKYTPLSPLYPNRSTGRRRALAQWLASKQNPLTARVAINQIWMRHFGRPLVDSVFDFGRNGKRPSHPTLLDWLAVEFMDNGWSMKHIHKLIVTSNTYRMQSGFRARSASEGDADNRYLWEFPRRRAEAEVIRDSILFATGELDPRVGGPVIENDVEPVPPRRSLYFAVYPEGGGSLKFMTLFDPPDPCDCYKRTESIVPQQALVMTNGRLLLEQSRLLARKLSEAGIDDSAFIIGAFETVLSRRPTPPEETACQEFLRKQCDLFRKAKPQPVKSEAIVPPSAEPTQRAREGLVRALFSHDDFITIR